jgi:hypothetical protein
MAQDTVATEHPEFKEARPLWARMRALIEGAEAVKAGSQYDPSGRTFQYLPTPPGMTQEDFGFYRERAQFYNALARTVVALAGAVFAKPPVIDAPDDVKQYAEDLTRKNEPLDTVALEIVTELVAVGRYAVFLDLSEAAPAGTFPYWALREAESVINWRTARVGSDPDQLVMVVIAEREEVDSEFGHECVMAYRQMTLVDGVYQSRMWRRVGSASEFTPGPWIISKRRGVPLDFIPFLFINAGGVDPCPTKPPLIDLGNVNIGHFRNSADHEQGLFNTAIPTYWAAGLAANSQPLKVGGSMAWMLPKDAAAGVLEFSGAGMKAILDAMAAKERQMATLGARLLEDPSAIAAETATAVRIKHSGEGAALRTISSTASTALTTLLRWAAWWAGSGEIDQGITVKLNQEFTNVKAAPAEITEQRNLWQARATSHETLYHALQEGGWAREGVDLDTERRAIDAEEALSPKPETMPSGAMPPAPAGE